MYARRRTIGSLQSQDLDGKPTFRFIVMGWSVNELICLKALRGGIVLVVVEESKTTEYFEDQRGLLIRKSGTGTFAWDSCRCYGIYIKTKE